VSRDDEVAQPTLAVAEVYPNGDPDVNASPLDFE